jgi:glucokinase
MNERPRVAIGIDVGGTKIAAGLLELSTGRVLVQQQMATESTRGAERLFEAVCGLADSLCGESMCGQVPRADWELAAIGLGLPELVTPRGEIVSDATIPWRGWNLAGRMGERFGVPVVVDADVRAAARGEARWGAGRSRRCFCYVTIGTGISGCLVLDGMPYLGARGLPGTFASSPRRWRDEQGTWRQAPPLEAVAAGPGLAAAYAKRQPGFTGDAREVLARAGQGDSLAAAVVTDAGRETGMAIGELVNALDPECIVLGGGLGAAPGLYREALEMGCREAIWSDEQRSLPLLAAFLGPEAGWIGAAVAAGERT